MAMELSRFTQSVELNNAWLVGLGVALELLAIWAVLVTSSFLLRQGIRASRIQTLEPFADGLYRRARLLAVILSLLMVVSGAGLLGYSIWKGIDLQPGVDGVLVQLTPDALMALGRSVALVMALLIGFYSMQFGSRRLASRVERRLHERIQDEGQRTYVEKLFTHLPAVINLALVYAVVRLASAAFALPAVVDWLITTIVYILLLVSGGRALVYLMYFLSERVLWAWEGKSKGTSLEEYYTAVRRLLPVGQKSVEAIIYVSMATLIVRRFEALEPFSPYGPIIIRVISMAFAASVVVELSRVMIARLLLAKLSIAEDAQRRRQTFVALLQTIVKYVIYFVVIMIVLEDFGVDPTPLLAGAGIVGLTVGLGAQKIVQDLLSGLFLLFEDQILNGDYVKIGDTEGLVEELTLRVTRIRDRFGRLHILRNGEIQNVINYSRGWTLAVVEMNIAYESDIDKCMEVITATAARLPEVLPGMAIDAPKVMGIEGMDESWLRVRIETRVAPGRHFEVKRALNRMLVDSFRAHNLEMPYPKSVQYSAEMEPPPAPAA
jgi:small-conductance mechanosensitive channel